MEIKDLLIFQTVARNGSISKAAEFDGGVAKKFVIDPHKMLR